MDIQKQDPETPSMDPMPEEPEPGESKAKPPITQEADGYAPESVNLVGNLTEDEQKLEAERTIKDYERDWDSMSGVRDRRNSVLKLFLGMIPPPEDGEMRSAIHIPIISKAVQRLQARVYDQQFPSNGEYFGVKPTDATDLERAVRVSKHLNWQVLTQIPEYVQNHDRLILQWLLYGSAFSYVYWDPDTNRPCHEVCRTEDIVISYMESSTDPNMGDVARITRIIRKYRHELEALADKGYYENIDKIFDPNNNGQSQSSQDGKDTPMQETTDRFEGKEKQDNDPGAPRKLIEQHCWRKLPGEEREKPVIVTVDLLSRQLIGLRPREDEDPEDRARYNREKQAQDTAYELAIQQYEADMVAYLQNVQHMTQPPMMGEQTSTGIPMAGEPTMSQPPAPGQGVAVSAPGIPPALPDPPVAPEAPQPPEPVKMIPINFFTHYVCDFSPEGYFGLGVGTMLEGHNMFADTAASQILDAGTVSLTKTFIFSRQAKMSRGDFKIRPGQGNETDLPPELLDKGIKVLDFGPIDAGPLGKLLESQEQAGDELSGAGDILSGEVGGSNETATTTQIRMSAAMTATSIKNKRYTRARTCEAQKIARLNSVHLGDEEYFTVVDPFKRVPPAPSQIARQDYLQDVDIYVTADPRMASQPQRVAEAMQAIQVTMSNPLLAGNVVLVAALFRNLYIAMDRPDLVAALDSPPPPPPMMAGAPQGQPQGPPPGGPQEKAPSAKPGGGPPRPHPQPMAPPVPNAGPEPTNSSVTQ